MKNALRIAALGAYLTLTAPLSASGEWPQFRGPDGQGHYEGRGLPLTWSETNHVKWKTPIHGRAWSCPVIWDNQIWMTTATEDGKELFAVCVNRESGKVEKDLKLFDVEAPQFAHKFNTYGSPTPAIEEGRVYVSFGSPGLACLDTKTGEKLWERRDFVCNHFRGAGSSPVIYKDLLLLHFDGSDYQYVAAVNKRTGETVWKTNRSIDYQDLTPEGKPDADGDWRKGFSTPLVAVFDNVPVMLSLGSKALYGYNPMTGEELWRVEERKSHSGSARPVVGPDMIYSCTGLGKNQFFAIRRGGKGLITDTHVVWKLTRGVPGKPSPLYLNGLLFMIDDGGITSCLDAKTGAEIWRERVSGNYSASPLYSDGRIYLCSEEGKCTVIEAGKQFKVLAENQLGDGFMASPAAAGKALFLRSRTHLYRIED